ncbi:MAG: ATP-binding protein [Pseudomonadota bacterium]
MFKKLLIAMIAMLVVVLLTILVRESRSVSAQFYLDYSNYVSQLRQGQRDQETLSDTLALVARQAQAVPNTAATLTGRLTQGVETLRAPGEGIRNPAVLEAARGYTSAVERLLVDTTEFTEQQNQLASVVTILRDDAPAVVRSLRDGGQEALSQSVFGLTADVIDFSTDKSTLPAEELDRRLAAVVSEAEGSSSGRLAAILDAAEAALAARNASLEPLERLSGSAYPASAQALYSAVAAMNASVTSKADRARLLLAAVCVLLLLAITMIGLRLKQSNENLNQTNAELEQFNISLEERVAERTRELSSAYEELQESQAQLVQAEKMSSLGELVAGISHEINTPLWYLLSNTSLIKERLGSFNQFVEITDDMLKMLRAGGNDKDAFVQQLRRLDHALNRDGLRDDLEESNDLLDDSVEGLEQLSEMAQSLKDFSRLDRAAVDAVNLNDGLEKTLVIAKNALKNGIEVRKNLGDLPNVSCSPSQINQVLLNLIKNASDAMDKGTGILTLSTWATDDKVYVSIQDNGEGMDEETLAKVRDPFFTTKEVGKGTGLGLSISQKIIDSHNGTLEIASEKGAGSTFTLSLPIGGDAEVSDMAKELEELEAYSKELEVDALKDAGESETDLMYATEQSA